MAVELTVSIDKAAPVITEGALNFETGATREQIADPSLFAYEHHGEAFSTSDRGALVEFYEDLIMGKALPSRFITKTIQDIDTLVAIALFSDRELAILPATPELVYTADLVHRLGLPALSHLEESKARFFSALRQHFPESLSQIELGKRLPNALEWIKGYVANGTMDVLGTAPNNDIRVIDHGTTGFVLAETGGSLWDGWVELYRLGFLRGALLKVVGDHKQVLISKKSHHVSFNLELACHLLNQTEMASGGAANVWRLLRGGLWLESCAPSLLLLEHIREILVRV